MTTTVPKPGLPKPTYRWYRYRLRSLLTFVTICAILCSWQIAKVRRAKTQEEAIRKILAKHGCVIIDSPDSTSLLTLGPTTFPKGWLQKHRQPYWRRALFGDTDLENVRAITFGAWFPPGDADLENLKCLDTLRELSFSGSGISNTGVTDEGLKHLKDLICLERLDLHGAGITNLGIEHLTALTHLAYVNLGDTQVTDAGVSKLHKALPKCEIDR